MTKHYGDDQGQLFGSLPNGIEIPKQFGTPPKFLHRREGPDTSKESAEKVDSTRLERLVFNTICSFGKRGCISDEVREKNPGYPYSSITARYKALLVKGYVLDTGERRIGKSGHRMRVMVAVEHCHEQ